MHLQLSIQLIHNLLIEMIFILKNTILREILTPEFISLKRAIITFHP